MSSQKSILNFFKPALTVKRNLVGNCNDSSNKKLKTCSNSSKVENELNSESIDLKLNNLISKTDAECVNDNKNDQSKSNVLTGEKTLPPMFYDEKKEIEKKRCQAKLKLYSKKFSLLDPEMGVTWIRTFEKEFNKPYFQKLNDFIEKERRNKTIYPPRDQVWTWTKHCDLDEVKVVIIGQDPYHNASQAHGLAFSVPVGVSIPPSLQNIYKELEENYKDYETPNHGYLMGWAMQGILLLNAVLTVEANKPNSHKDQGWEQLTSAVIKYLNDNFKGIVFMLWGSYAQKKADFVDTKKHHVLKAPHPSPLSAHRGFFGCRHFLLCNELLVKQELVPINWDWLPKAEDISGVASEIVPLHPYQERFDSRQTEMLKPFFAEKDPVTKDFIKTEDLVKNFTNFKY